MTRRLTVAAAAAYTIALLAAWAICKAAATIDDGLAEW